MTLLVKIMAKSILFLSTILLILTSCEKIEGEHTMGLGDVIANGDISIRFKGFQDTRCPIGVNCISAGEVWANFDITANGTTSAYSIGDGNTYPLIEEINGYRITFVNLLPHPEDGVIIPDGDIKLQITITEI